MQEQITNRAFFIFFKSEESALAWALNHKKQRRAGFTTSSPLDAPEKHFGLLGQLRD